MSQPSVAGARVLIVEDEALVVMMLEEMLEELGCVVAGIAAHLTQAEQMIESERFDCALLDINLAGKEVYGLARRLGARGTPFIFVTGYDVPDLPAEFRPRPVLRKPFDFASLAQALTTAVSRKPRSMPSGPT
jgi:CheY-like chemotaxis protein